MRMRAGILDISLNLFAPVSYSRINLEILYFSRVP